MRMSTWMRLAMAAMLAGCSFEPGALRSPDDRDGAPPPPDAPPTIPIDAAPPDAPPDTDGDTVIDPEDNCPANPNSEQADCDGDGQGDACDLTSDGPDMDEDNVADACDNCPTVANEDQAGGMDDDEVGDACDPRRTAGGDTIAYFESFDTDSQGPPPGWTVATGPELASPTWRVQAGALVSEPTVQPTIIYLSGVTLPADAVIETRSSSQGVIIDLGAVASGGVVSRYTNGASSDTGAMCVVEQILDESSPAGVRIRNLAGSPSQVEQAPWRAEVDQAFITVHVRHGAGSGSTNRCTVTPADAQLVPVQSAVPDLPGPASGDIGLRAVRSQRAVEYILVYGLGGPLPAP
jgi:hypothetical protein